jgi:histidine triad (HIT) family protein
MNETCLFCKIVAGEEPSVKIWEDKDFVCIKNKFPVAPTHVLVMPKAHIKKVEVATSEKGEFWGKMMGAVFAVVHELNLDQTGYKLVNNGAGYNHFEHEHVHILGGSKTEPGGQT